MEGKGGFSCLDQITIKAVGVAIKALADGIRDAAVDGIKDAEDMNMVADHLMAVQLLY